MGGGDNFVLVSLPLYSLMSLELSRYFNLAPSNRLIQHRGTLNTGLQRVQRNPLLPDNSAFVGTFLYLNTELQRSCDLKKKSVRISSQDP